ncbi:MAG: O-antigen ligase family protein [Planctomycetaceae bacterium]
MVSERIFSRKNETQRRRSKSREFQYQGERPLVATALLAGLGLIAFAVLLGLTRGGALALAVSVTVCLFVCFLRGYLSSRMILGLGLGGVLVGGSLFLYGFDDDSIKLDDWEVDRWQIWQANLEIFNDYPILGTGLGSHFQSYRSYLNTPLFESRFTHAESGYLQVLSETGLVGISLLGLALLFPSTGACVAYGWRRTIRKSLCLPLCWEALSQIMCMPLSILSGGFPPV